MKAIRWIILVSFLGLFCMTSCEKESKEWTEFPPETQTGANTIDCLVNGELWATGKLPGIYKFPPMKAEYRDYGDYIHLEFYAGGNGGSIGFFINNPQLGSNKGRISCRFDIHPECTVLVYDYAGLYITKMDLENKILSGRFVFDVPCKEDSTKILHITEGRFDLYMSVLR